MNGLRDKYPEPRTLYEAKLRLQARLAMCLAEFWRCFSSIPLIGLVLDDHAARLHRCALLLEDMADAESEMR